MEFVTGLRYHGGWSEEIFQGEEICGIEATGGTFPRREKGKEEESRRYKARTQCQHAERRVAFIYPSVISVICVYFVTNVNTVGPIRCYDKRYANIFQ